MAALLVTRPQTARADDPGATAADTKREADARYREARALYERGEWNAALGAFAAARQLRPTWASTAGVAFCLAKLKRYDDAIETFEAVLREFGGELSPQVKADAQAQIEELRRHLGALDIQGSEPGAIITVDGRGRGQYPLPGPLRLTEGTHVVLVTMHGFEPYVTSVNVGADRIARVDARLRPLRSSGRLRVEDKEGRALDVVVDGSVIGKTPWEGPLAPGEHMVALRGEGDLGTLPSRVAVEIDRTALLTLVAEALTAELRIEPVPANASVAIDGITVGRGLWEGRLRPGEYRIEIAAAGFLPSSRALVIGDKERKTVRLTLERDTSSPFFRAPPRRSRFLVEADTSIALWIHTGCDGAESCGSPLEAAGGSAVLHAGYELGMGLGFGVTLGYGALSGSRAGVPAEVYPVGLSPNPGAFDEHSSLRGALTGAWAGFTAGDRVLFHARVGAGAFLGSLVAEVTNSQFINNNGNAYSVGPLLQRHSLALLYVAPELRVGFALSRRVEISVGIAAPIFIGFGKQPVWDPSQTFLAGDDGIGWFPERELVSQIFLTLAPGIGARYDF